MIMEILPWYDGGFLVRFCGVSKERVEEIRKQVFTDLIRRGFLPRPNEVQRRDGTYYFEIVVKHECLNLLNALKQSLVRVGGMVRVDVGTVVREVKEHGGKVIPAQNISISECQELYCRGIAATMDGDKMSCVLKPNK